MSNEISNTTKSEPAPNKAKKKKGPNKIVKYLKDLRSEIKKVVWPSRKQVLNNTGIVLATVIITGIFLFGIDSLLGLLVNLLVK